MRSTLRSNAGVESVRASRRREVRRTGVVFEAVLPAAQPIAASRSSASQSFMPAVVFQSSELLPTFPNPDELPLELKKPDEGPVVEFPNQIVAE